MQTERDTGDHVLAQLARRQHGIVAKRQLLAMGIGAGAIKYRLGTGRLHLLHRGVYAVGHTKLTLRARWMAAVLACGDGAVLSHWDGAALTGLLKPKGRRYHVTVPGQRRGPPGIQLHRARGLEPADRTIWDGIPVTSLPRTLLDLAEVADTATLERAYEEAMRQQHFDLRAIEGLRHRSRGRRGLKPLIALLETHDGHAPDIRSELEQLFATFCKQSGLPRPHTNVLVEGFLVDVVWPDAKLIVELDSWAYHRGRKAFEGDRERDAALHAAGYVPIRVTHRRLTDDRQALKTQLQSLIRERSGSLP